MLALWRAQMAPTQANHPMGAESAGITTMARPACGRRGLLIGFAATALAGSLTPTALVAQSAEKKARLPQGLPPLPSVDDQISVHELAGVALRGFDPVGYHAEGRALAGSAAHEATRDGVVWRFASAANRETFLADPDIYLPAFDGHDAEGIARDRLVSADPTVFAVLDGRLHLFRSPENRERYLGDATLARQAREHWPHLRHQAGG
jgi:YHS domain-containing protein